MDLITRVDPRAEIPFTAFPYFKLTFNPSVLFYLFVVSVVFVVAAAVLFCFGFCFCILFISQLNCVMEHPIIKSIPADIHLFKVNNGKTKKCVESVHKYQ